MKRFFVFPNPRLQIKFPTSDGKYSFFYVHLHFLVKCVLFNLMFLLARVFENHFECAVGITQPPKNI